MWVLNIYRYSNCQAFRSCGYSKNVGIENVWVFKIVGFQICWSLKIMGTQRTSFHKGVFLGPEYFNNILGTNSHIKGTCIAANFESNGPLVWCLLSIKSGWGNSIPVLPEVMN